MANKSRKGKDPVAEEAAMYDKLGKFSEQLRTFAEKNQLEAFMFTELGKERAGITGHFSSALVYVMVKELATQYPQVFDKALRDIEASKVPSTLEVLRN